jgi:HTH-like domain
VNALCQMTGVSRAGFYRSRLPRQAAPVEMEIRDEMQKIALESPAYGYRRITADLQHRGFDVNHKRVLRMNPRPTCRSVGRPLPTTATPWIWAPFVPARGPALSCGLAAFFTGVVFLGTVVLVLAAVVGLAPLAVVRPLAAAFGRPVVLAGVACSGATLAAWGAAFGVASLLVVMLVSLCRDQRGHGHESLNCATEASGFGRCHGAGLAIASLLAGLAERRKTYPIWNMACAD